MAQAAAHPGGIRNREAPGATFAQHKEIDDGGGQTEIRRILGTTSLARQHRAALTDDACAAALDSGIPTNPYRFVRNWLERKTPLTLRQVDPISRQLTLHRDFIDQKTQENQE